MKTKKLIGALYKILFAAPLIIGVSSYLYAGESFSDALYYSIKLYGMNYEKPEVFIAALELARWLAPLMTAASIMVVVKSLFSYLQVHIGAMGRNGNVVYGDSEYACMLCENEKSTVWCKGAPISYAKNHFIMFRSDMENLSFCQKNLHRMKGKNIYVCMNELDATLLKEMEGTSIKFFNPNDVIARRFWKERQLWVDAPAEYKIAIVGFGHLGRRMLEKALQLNLFSTKQKIKYYVFGNGKHFKISHSEMDLMNQDKILYFDEDSEEQWKKLKSMDMIVLTENSDMDLIQKVLCCSSPACKVYYYSPQDEKLSEFIDTDRLFPYGNSREVFTLENIKTDKLYRKAIALNREYVNKYHSSEWEQLTGFFKDSNISSADYGEIVGLLHKKGMSDRELAELEHIRWSRFYFLRYWKYGVPANGTNKDEVQKIHKCLLPFAELDDNEQKKDFDVIEQWKDSTDR